MLKIVEYNPNVNCQSLKNDETLFHNALKRVVMGEKRFHVDIYSPYEFDLLYEDNDQIAKNDPNIIDYIYHIHNR